MKQSSPRPLRKPAPPTPARRRSKSAYRNSKGSRIGKGRHTVRGALGMVVLEHGDGAVRILSAPCPGKLCVKQGAAHRSGEKLVCVPSRVVVSLEGGAPDGQVLDAVH
jgi:hypothetical protein